MRLTPEEMFSLATGLVDITSWASSTDAETSPGTNTSKRKASSHSVGITEVPVSSPRMGPREDAARYPISPRKNSCSPTSSRSTITGSCTAPSLPIGSQAKYSTRPVVNRTSWRTFYLTFFVVVFAFTVRTADGCSSRSTPKPRPPPPSPSPSPAVRPNITFQTYACPPAYATYYCLNGATCFTIKIGESILYNCECTDGYMGQRCEYKDLDGSYLPLREKIMLERASIAGGATVAVVLVVIISITFYAYIRQKKKENRLSSDNDFRSTPSHTKTALNIAVLQHLKRQQCLVQCSSIKVRQLNDVDIFMPNPPATYSARLALGGASIYTTAKPGKCVVNKDVMMIHTVDRDNNKETLLPVGIFVNSNDSP